MKKAKSKRQGPRTKRVVRTLLGALQGAPFEGPIAESQTLLASLGSIRGFPRGKPKDGLAMPVNAHIWTACRDVQGSDCGKKAQILANYLNWLAPGDKPIGEASVTALLNLAASQRCADEVQCPKKCLASFTEQKKLFDYHYFDGGPAGKNAYESGILTIPETEWNCHCQEEVTN